MAVPKKKKSKSRRDMRRSHHALKGTMVAENATTGELQLPHHISLDGYYRGRQVIAAAANAPAELEDLAETL